MTGFDLMPEDQRAEWMDLEERQTHSETMVFSELDACTLKEYRELAHRLESEHRKNMAL